MTIDRLHFILHKCTVQYRKGPTVTGNPELVNQIHEMAQGKRDELTARGIAEIYSMPHVEEAPHNHTLVDVHFMMIGVKDGMAALYAQELWDILVSPLCATIGDGTSYIELGALLEDQDMGLSLMALGEALGFWRVVTPEMINITGTNADTMAGMGFVIISESKTAEQRRKDHAGRRNPYD